MGVSEAETEKVLRGSREGFSDSVKTNSALVRKRLRDTRLKVEEHTVGVRSNTVLQMLYVEDLVHEELLEEVKSRLEGFAVDGILDSGMLEQLTKDINILAENYPELKSSNNFMELQKTIADVEEHLQAARRLYNANVNTYNTKLVVFPSSIVANNMHAVKKPFFEAEEAKRHDVKMSF